MPPLPLVNDVSSVTISKTGYRNMPTHTIQVSEYECGHCGWKWINRINGKDRPVPLKCAKCKRLNWNNPLDDVMGYTERGLQVRLANLEPDETNPRYRMGRNIQEPNDLCRKFLNLSYQSMVFQIIFSFEAWRCFSFFYFFSCIYSIKTRLYDLHPRLCY